MKRHDITPLFDPASLVGGVTTPPWRSAGWQRALLAVLAVGLLAGVPTPAQAQRTLPMAVTAAMPVAKFAAKTQAQGQDQSVLRRREVAVHLQHLNPQVGTPAPQVGVELFDGSVLTLDLKRIEQRGSGNYTWHGKVEGYGKSRVTLSVVSGQVAGTIVLIDDGSQVGGVYQILSGPDGAPSLLQIDPNGFPPDHPPGSENRRAPPPANQALSGAADSSGTPVAAADSGATIDVMVVYSNQTAAAAGAGIGAQIQQAVDTANAVYANSGITTRLRLVYSGPANYNESGDYGTDLNWLSGAAGVATLRNTYGADMVSLFIENGQYCGMAWIGPSAGSAFSVINRGCASGNYSFPHELGHNFGALHNPETDPTPGYNHGYNRAALGIGGDRDVMSYAPGTRIAYLSNPNILVSGLPMGTATTSDVARVHNQNAVTVANFRAAVTGGCTYTLSPASAGVGAIAGNGSFSVTAGAGCAWNTVSNAVWLTVAAGSGATESGILNYTWAANSGVARSGTFTVGGQTFTVNQASGCSYSLTSTSASVAAGGGSGTTSLTTTSGCPWTATSSASWLTLTSATSGSGNATVSYTVAANTGASRSANLTVGGITFMVTQAAAPAQATMSTTALTSSANPSTAGAMVTFTATVTGAAPTGTVGFTDGGVTIGGCGAVALTGSGNARTAACSTNASTVGVHTVTATYGGDAANGPSLSAALSQTVAAVLAGTGTIVANPYGALTVQGGTISGNTLSNLQPNVIIQLGTTAGAAGSYAEIDIQGLNLGPGTVFTIRSGAAGQTLVLADTAGAASAISGALVAQGSNGAAAPVIYLRNPSGFAIGANGTLWAPSGLTVDALGMGRTTGKDIVNAGSLDGGSSLTLYGSNIRGGGAFKGNAVVVSTFGSANNPVNGAHYLANGLQLFPSSGSDVYVTINDYANAPQYFNLMVNGNAHLWMPSAWPSSMNLPQNNQPVPPGGVRAAGVPDPAYGASSSIFQASGTMTLIGNDFVFPGAIVLKSGGTLDLKGVIVNQGWTTAGQAFQGTYFESPNIVSSAGNIQVLTNNLNWVNFSTMPQAPVRTWSLVRAADGNAQYVPADSLAPHLNVYSVLIEAAVAGQCWVCLVNNLPINMN